MKILKTVIALSLLLGGVSDALSQGMWLPSLVGKERIKDMQQKGLKLSAKDLYDINNSSLKDAIVSFNGGCTGELISNEGLLITNHHCGYGQIQSHSTIEHDYLTNGFVAADRSQELANEGLKVHFLQQMSDVTKEVMKGTKNVTDKVEKDSIINHNIKALIAQNANPEKSIWARVEPLYYGNEYYMFVYQSYLDVRLVMAPASSIGKFGGDTDNWMWPRHTGDFSMFRIYANADNEPAAYSPDNVPYTPKRSFVISRKGVQEDDFTFVYGFPGRTQQYLHSAAIDYITEYGNPVKIGLRTKRLEIMNAAQAADPAVRIKYASKNASVSNAWKKWQGELLGLKRLKTADKKVELEKEFDAWASNKAEYKGLIAQFQELYDQLEEYALAVDYYTESAMVMEFRTLAAQYQKEGAKVNYAAFFKNYERSIDSTTSDFLFKEFVANVPSKFRPEGYDDAQAVIKDIFENSIFVDSTKLRQATREQITTDPAFKLSVALSQKMAEVVAPYTQINKQITELYSSYMRGIMELRPDYPYFPDANSTLRIAYGKVQGYAPRDAVYYTPVSTLKGVMQKDNPDIYDYDVPQKLRDVYASGEFGDYATVGGEVPVAFIATNHTSGGNSGSPVLNANGELIGVNFDRVWEGTMSDLEFDPEVCRNISLDIRYVLFNLEVLYGAGYLLDEMNFAD
ncbi:MAG: S46 family peptidase [Rikenellaceae bacterium]